MNKPLISIISIVNNEKIYAAFKENLSTQTNISYELLKISNSHHEFSSARTAYNSAAAKAHGKYLVFCHPDIRFLAKNSLLDIITSITKLEKLGVAGVAGSPFELVDNNRVILSNIVHGEQKTNAGKDISRPVEVQTVDECLFILTKDYWLNHPFSHESGWHLYAVEQCLAANQAGLKNFVVPAELWHTSDGQSEDYHYYTHLRHLVRQYRNVLPRINTTVKMWPTRGLKSQLYISYWQLNRWIKKILKLKVLK